MNKPRGVVPFIKLVDMDWQLLRSALLHWRYRDADGNDRKFSSLHAAYTHKVHQAAEHGGKAHEDKRALENVLERSGVKLWSTLQAQVCLALLGVGCWS